MTTESGVIDDVLYLTPDDDNNEPSTEQSKEQSTGNQDFETNEVDLNVDRNDFEPQNESGYMPGISLNTTTSLNDDNNTSTLEQNELQDRLIEENAKETLNDDQIAVTDNRDEKFKQLFKNTRYFLIKSLNHENVDLAKAKSVWSTPRVNENKLNRAFRECANVILIFSVSESGRFQGYARLASESKHTDQTVNWLLPPNLNPKSLSGIFKIDWISKKELQFNKTQYLLNTWNENKPVKIGRDGQEIEPNCGESLCLLFPLDTDVHIEEIAEKSLEHSKSLSTTLTATTQYSDQHHHNDSTHHYSKTKRRSNPREDNYYPSHYQQRHEYHRQHELDRSSKHKHRSPSPKKRRRSDTPPLINIPKDVVLNGTYQDYQSYLAASSTSLYQQPQLHQPYYTGLHTQPTSIPSQYPMSSQMATLQYPQAYVNGNGYGVQPFNYQMNMYAQVPQVSVQAAPQKFSSKYEQDVEEFLRRTSNPHQSTASSRTSKTREHAKTSSHRGTNKNRSRSRSNTPYSSNSGDDRNRMSVRR